MKALRRSQTSSSSSASANSSSAISSSPPQQHSSWNQIRALLVVTSSNPSSASDRGTLKSPWSRRKRKHVLSRHQWIELFTEDGRLRDGGVKFLKKVRSGGVDPSIRTEVWPFLLGVYDLSSSKAERDSIRKDKRKDYKKLRRQSRRLFKLRDDCCRDMDDIFDGSSCFDDGPETPFEEDFSSRNSPIIEERHNENYIHPLCDIHTFSSSVHLEERGLVTNIDAPEMDSESSDSESCIEDYDSIRLPSLLEENEETAQQFGSASIKRDSPNSHWTVEDFSSWRRIIRLDALRLDSECRYSPKQMSVSMEEACKVAEAVGLRDYDHLEACRIYHAARLVAILESYAVYDQEIGYCQGMSDLLSPIVAVIDEDHDAFWCFVAFMKKARHNFRLDEAGIKRQLKIVSKIIKSKDSHLYRHLEKLQAEDCFFVYRMVVVLFRRELSFEQTLCLWEVIWADQAAIRAGIGKSAWGRIRPRAPPTDDLLLYAIAASVLQRRKLIIEKYSSMDEIVRECNSMTGQLDVWKLLDDAHDLVVSLHDKVS